MAIGDEFDTGNTNEVLSQTDIFQGTLKFMNESNKIKAEATQNLTLPRP